MNQFIKRNFYKYYLLIRINLLWIIWYLNNKRRIDKLRKIIDAWNINIPSFGKRFLYFNTQIFIENYKYWIHWISKMDAREKLVFKELIPFALLDEEEWIHFDLSKKEVPIIYYSFYSADDEWLPITIFQSIEHLQIYISIIDATSKSLVSYIKTIVQTERLLLSKERILKKNGGFEKIIIDDEGLRLNPEYLKELNKRKEQK
jgi:hypothetical protein